MNLGQFKYFALTVKYGSYASAAEHAFVTAPAVSRAEGRFAANEGVTE